MNFIQPFSTGLTECFDGRGRLIPCEGTGQDAQYMKGSKWTKERFKVMDGVVQDLFTGLVWSLDANLFGYPSTWVEALESIQSLNQHGYQGYSDWRLPNRREFRSILDLREKRPALPKGHPFKNVFSGWYWTSTSFAGNTQYAWWVHMEGARMFYGKKDQYALFWPVRGVGKGVVMATGQRGCFAENGEEIPCEGTGQDGEYRCGAWVEGQRFKVMDPSNVLDTLTGLVWSRDAGLFATPLNWEDALVQIKVLNQDGYGGAREWRLPNINELESLVDASSAFPALSKGHPFLNVMDVYWSSTTSMFETDWAWALYMGKGATGVGLKTVARFYLWPVKDYK